MNEGMLEITKEIHLDISEMEYIEVLDKLSNTIKPLKLYKNAMLKNIHQLKLTNLTKGNEDLQTINLLVAAVKELLSENQSLKTKADKAIEVSERYLGENRELQKSLESLETKFSRYKEDESQKFASLRKQFEETNSKLTEDLKNNEIMLNDGKKKIDGLFKSLFDSDQKIAVLTAEKEELHKTIKIQQIDMAGLKEAMAKTINKLSHQYHQNLFNSSLEQPQKRVRDLNRDKMKCMTPKKRSLVQGSEEFEKVQENNSYSNAKSSSFNTEISNTQLIRHTDDLADKKNQNPEDYIHNEENSCEKLSMINEDIDWKASKSHKLLSIMDSTKGFTVLEYLDSESISNLQVLSRLHHFSLSSDKRVVSLLHKRSLHYLIEINKELQSRLNSFKIEASKHTSSLKRYYVYKLLYKGELSSFIDEFEARFINLMDKLLSFQKPYKAPPADDNEQKSFFSRLKDRIPQFSAQELVI